MSKPLTYSASQIEAWEDCPRKWGWDKIDAIRRADTAATKLGTAVHNQLERYLKGEPFDFASDHHAAQLAQGATPFLPAPRAYGLAVEAEDLQFPSPTYPHLWTGRIDWYLHAPGKLTIGDHKTTSSIAKWAKSTIVLRRDVQANIYAKFGLIIRPELGEIELQWTYIQTRDARLVEPRKLTVLRPEVESRFAEIDATANEITIARQGIQTAKDLPYNSDSCDKYGGCSYQHLCNLSPLVQLRSFMSNSPNNDFLAKMQALQGGAPAAAPAFQLPMAQAPAPIAQAPAPHADLGFMAVRDEHGRVIKSLTGKALPEQVIMTQHVQNPETGGYLALNPLTSIVADLLEKHAVRHAEDLARGVQQSPPAPPVVQAPPAAPPAWTPPGAPMPPPAAPVVQAAPPVWTPPAVTGPVNPPEWNPPPSPTAANPLPAAGLPTPPTAPEAPKKRGRPAGSKNKPPEANAAQGTLTSNPVTDTAVALQDHQIIGTLYLGCRPMDCNDRTFDIQDFILDANNRIAKEFSIPDYSLIDYKGSGTLLAFVLDIITTQYRGCDLIVDLDSREAPILSAALAARAVNVIRRF